MLLASASCCSRSVSACSSHARVANQLQICLREHTCSPAGTLSRRPTACGCYADLLHDQATQSFRGLALVVSFAPSTLRRLEEIPYHALESLDVICVIPVQDAFEAFINAVHLDLDHLEVGLVRAARSAPCWTRGRPKSSRVRVTLTPGSAKGGRHAQGRGGCHLDWAVCTHAPGSCWIVSSVSSKVEAFHKRKALSRGPLKARSRLRFLTDLGVLTACCALA